MSLQVDMLVQVDEAQIPAQETPAEPLYSMAITGKHIILYGEKLQNHRKSTTDQQLHMDMLCIPLYTYGIFHCQVRLPKRNNIGSIGQMRSFHSHAEETTCKWNISEHFKTTQNPPNTISKQNDIPRGIPIEDNSRIWCLHDVHQCARGVAAEPCPAANSRFLNFLSKYSWHRAGPPAPAFCRNIWWT